MSNKTLSVSQNAFYNMVGALVFCFCQWITSALLVVHLSPEDISVSNSGLLQLAISVTNIFFAISCYNMRTFQVSDIKNEYSTGDYIGTRIVTATIAVVLCVLYTVALGYSLRTVTCVFLYMIFKLNETFGDVLHAVDQKNYRMDYICVSFVVRGIVMVASFAIAILVTHDVLIAVLAMAVCTIAVVVFYDVSRAKTFDSVKPVFNKNKIARILWVCLPNVISSATFVAVTTIPRQMLEKTMGEEALGYYGTIATPIMVVQILATSIFNPMTTELTKYYNQRESKKFLMLLLRNFLIVVGITTAVFVGVAVVGEFAVGLVFGHKFVPYTNLMYGIMGCTAMYSVCWLCTNSLIIMRKLIVSMAASIIALIVSISLCKNFITVFGMNGVSFSIIVAYVIHALFCGIVIVKNLKTKENG